MDQHEKANGMPFQGTAQTKAYAAFRQRIANLCKGIGDKEELAEWAERNAVLREMADMALRDLRPSQVHVDEVLTSMSVMFANDELIGDRIMPVVMGNGKLSFTYFEYDKRDRTAYPDDTMADRSDPNELGQNRSTKSVGLEVRSLKEFLDQYTIQNQDAPLNEIVDVVDNVLYGLFFRKEMRVIREATDPTKFGSNTTALAAGDRWDGPTGGDPGAVVDGALAACWSGSGPGKFVGAMSLGVYNVLKRHPKILDSFKYSGTSAKMANRQMLAEYFELDDIVVGKARQDTANRGQAASYSRMWPDVFGVYRVSERPSVRNAAFGYSFQDKPTEQDLQFLLEKSAKGAWQARATHADVQKIIAPECAFLITTPIG